MLTVIEAVEALRDIAADKGQRDGMEAVRDMLYEFDEDTWEEMSPDERTEWLKQFLLCEMKQ